MARGAGVELHLGLFGDTQIAARLLQTVGRIDDASEWFRMMSGWLEKELGKQFDTEGAHWGGRGWKSLADSTVAARVAGGYPGEHPILNVTGELRKSLTKGGGDAIRLVSRHQLVFGSTVDYGAAHQIGNELGRPPKRQILNLGKKETRQIARSLGLFINRVSAPVEPGEFFSGTGGGGS